MKSFFNKILIFLLIFIVCCGVFGCSCSTNENNNNTEQEDIVVKEKFDGNHDLTAPFVESNDYLLSNGSSNYKIVISKNNSSNAINLCVEEFNSLFKKATGITLPTVYDVNVSYNDGSQYISLGNNTFFQASGVQFDAKELKTDGCRIITKGKSIFLLGATDYGVLNAVYDFMQIYFNYDYYFRNCIDIDTGIKTLKLRNFNVKDIPDVGIRSSINGAFANSIYSNPRTTDVLAFGSDASIDAKNRIVRYRFNNDFFAKFLPIYSEFNNTNSDCNTIHNAFNYVSSSEVRPGWYSLSGEQLCYSASSHTDHFDEENYNALVEHCAKKIENSLKIYPRDIYPQYSIVSLTQTDRGGFCTCPTCLKWKEEDNGAISGAMIRLNNAVIKLVKEWMDLPENEPYKRDDLKLVLFSYNSSEPCPVVFDDEKKVYVPANDKVIMEENTGVYFAPQSSFNWVYSIYDKKNDVGRELCKQWTSLSNYTMLWLYGAFHTKPMYFMDSYNFFNTDAYQFFSSLNFDTIYDENIDYSSELTGFNAMKTYIESKLLWDSSLEQDYLIKKFMKAMYKDASDIMYDLFMEYRVHFAYILEQKKFYYGMYPINKSDNYPVSVLKKWVTYIDSALDVIKKYEETDNNLYLILKDRVEMESVCPLFCLLQIYGDISYSSPFTVEERANYINRLTNIATKYPDFAYDTYQSVLSFVQSLD